MPTLLFQFSRKLKISRFTIDVLMERLSNLRPPRQPAADEWEGFVGRTYERLKACDQLHSELGEQFDVVMLTAVWMHLDEAQRELAMPNVSALVRNGGIVIMSLRHGPIPPGRRMFEVSAEETIALAQRSDLFCTLNREAESSLRQPGVSWTRLAFQKDTDRIIT